jgi:hypothetical protein
MLRLTVLRMDRAMGVNRILFTVLVVVLAGFKYLLAGSVISLETRLATINRAVADDRKEIRTLNAEMAVLTSPERISRLSHRFLPELTPVKPAQLGTIEEIPFK